MGASSSTSTTRTRRCRRSAQTDARPPYAPPARPDTAAGPAYRRVDLDRGGPAEPRVPAARRARPARTLDPGEPDRDPQRLRRRRLREQVASFGPGLPRRATPTPTGPRQPGLEIVGSPPWLRPCEVVCFGPRPHRVLGGLTGRGRGPRRGVGRPDRRAVRVARHRQVFVFENRGPEIGVTLHHPHGQIYAYPYVTPRTGALLASIDFYGPALMGDILEFEPKSERVLIARRALHRLRAVRRPLADRDPHAPAPARARLRRDH